MTKEPPGQIKLQVRQLIRQRAFERGTDITYKLIHEATGLSMSTISDWVSGKRSGDYDAKVLAWFCEYLDCQPCDLMVYERDGKTA